MARLYWRVKKNGKWTWRPLVLTSEFDKKLVARLPRPEGDEK